MDSNNENTKEEIEESKGTKAQVQIPLHISGSRRTLLSNKDSQVNNHDSLASFTSRINLFKFGSASAKFKRLADKRDEISRSVFPSSGQNFRELINKVFARKIDWSSLLRMGKQWIRDPINMALIFLMTCAAISGAILFLVMTGILNSAIPKKSQRDEWLEVNNQILNALFTLMCLYQFPKQCYHLVLLCRWKPKDIIKLRKIYCKNGTYKPREWAHMIIVLILLQLNCFAQYALCGLNLGYKRSERPAIGVGICNSFTTGASAFASLYSNISPLGRNYAFEMDEESQVPITPSETKRLEQLRAKSLEKRYSFSFVNRNVQVQPLWSGGVLDFLDDISLAYLSLFCSFCVFGWNMERLGFGNMYVHIASFFLLCLAPFLIFNLAAVNIDNESIREALGLTGAILSGFGLLYGGFWRIQMRKRFNLPAYTFCFGQSAISDCTLWLCCCWCSLAQEVRTGNSYDIIEDKFYREGAASSSHVPSDGPSGPSSPLGNNCDPSKNSSANSPSPTAVSKGYNNPGRQLSVVQEESSAGGIDINMAPPTPPLIQREET